MSGEVKTDVTSSNDAIASAWEPEELHEVAIPREFFSRFRSTASTRERVHAEHLVDVREVASFNSKSKSVGSEIDITAQIDITDAALADNAVESGERRRRREDQPVTWLTNILNQSVDRNLSIHILLKEGRGFLAEGILRRRATFKGEHLWPEFEWNGPEILVGKILVGMAELQQNILTTDSDAVSEMRIAARLAGIELERSLISYAATELIDPQVMDSSLSLDVLCHSEQVMTREVILRLGLARGYLDEVTNAQEHYSFRDAPTWSSIERAWQAESASAHNLSATWAREAIKRGRSLR